MPLCGEEGGNPLPGLHSSGFPATLARYVDDSIKIASEDDPLSVCIPQRNVMEFAVLKPRIFAFAAPSMWVVWAAFFILHIIAFTLVC